LMPMYSRQTSVSTQLGGRPTIVFFDDVSSTRQHSISGTRRRLRSVLYFWTTRVASARRCNCYTLFTRYDRVERTAVRSTGCQTGLYNRCDNRLYTRYSRLSNGFDNRLNVCTQDTTGCQTGLTTGLTTGCIV